MVKFEDSAISMKSPLASNLKHWRSYSCSVFPTTKVFIELKELSCIDNVIKNRGNCEEQI